MTRAYFKKLLPRGLFARSLLIITVPIVLIQAIMVYFFYQRHWESVTRNMASGLAGEIAMIAHQSKRLSASERNLFLDVSNSNLDLKATLSPRREYKKGRNLSKEYAFLSRALEQKIKDPFSINEGAEVISVQLKLENGALHVEIPKKRLVSPTTYLFIMWMIGSSVILVSIASVFLKNQIRPIVSLADASEKFGRGLDMPKFKPSGAREVRKAASAFMVMSKRIKRQVKQRTEMLAAISHDLRSPLTRMKLQLVMLPESQELDYLKQDVQQMEKTIESYLQFARGEGSEEVSSITLTEFFGELILSFSRQNKMIDYDVSVEDIIFQGRRIELFRALSNLLDNAFFYGKSVVFQVATNEDFLFITIADDGPGIPEENRKDAFNAFYRLDKSRTPNKGGVGLGLTIARDIILGHGGDIKLDKGELGGLLVAIKLPL